MELTKKVKISDINKLEFYKHIIEKHSPKSELRRKKLDKLLGHPVRNSIFIDCTEYNKLLMPLHDEKESPPTYTLLSLSAAVATGITINLLEDKKTILDIYISFRILDTPMGNIIKDIPVNSFDLIPIQKEKTIKSTITGFYLRVKSG